MSALPYQQAFFGRNDFRGALSHEASIRAPCRDMTLGGGLGGGRHNGSRNIRCALFALSLFCFAPTAARAVDAEATVAGSDEDVTITQGADRTVFEYRQNGGLRMVKIVPAQGKPYYLVPADPTQGNGDLEHAGKLVPSWRIVEF